MGERKRTSPVSVTLEYPKGKQKAVFCKRYGLNSIYAGKHWSKRSEDARDMRDLVLAELYRQKIPRKIYERPVGIAFYFNDRLDCDNHALIQKLVIDALKGYLIQDDSKKYVRKVSSEFHEEDYILVEVFEIGTVY